jgi:hypothetical protein
VFKPGPGKRYDMPVVFGPSELRGQSSSRELQMITHSFLTDPAAVEPLVPYHFSLAEPARVCVIGRMHFGVDWLGGRNYQSVRVSIDAEAKDGDAVLRAPYGLVLWESNPYPVIAGREYLGVAKLVADVPEHERGENTAAFECYEYGTRLLRVDVTDITAADEAAIDRANSHDSVSLAWKYIPGPGGIADVDYPIKMVSRGKVSAMWTGAGSVTFGKPTWQRCPHSHRIVKTLAALPVLEVLPAVLTTSTSTLHRDATERIGE